ncbi:MAG: retron St85 family RNA-directed DNA polymerase [Alteromonas macleodii]|nr:retron St85 family RNA-directed DNA polymerase [Alteromonas macleodii]
MQLSILSCFTPEDFETDLNQYLAEKPSHHYKVYKIPKRTIGFRVIAQPTPKLKSIQRKIVEKMMSYLVVHSAAKAYVKSCSIKDNALVHANSNFLLKLDLENFFNSLTPDMLKRAVQYQGFSIVEKETNALNELLFWNKSKKKKANLYLSVGAPSSPFLSNVIMFEFDEAVTKLCKQLGISYSRYADDLTFSTSVKNVLFEVPKIIEEILLQMFGGKLKLNYSKTRFSSKAHNRHVTGITLTNNNKLSLGRERKRYIRSLLHKFSNSLLSEDDINSLKGLISFAMNVEPAFIAKMKAHYGTALFDELNRYNCGNN